MLKGDRTLLGQALRSLSDQSISLLFAMPYTVSSSFTAFRSNTVDLETTQTSRARTSRDYLIGQVKTLAANDSLFPRLDGNPIHYGSFARRTKIRPLDDIDIMVVLNVRGTAENYRGGGLSWLRINDPTASLASFPDNYGYVSSIKVLDRMKAELSKLSSYRKAEVRRNQQAVVLNLSSYDWSFDLVPAVAIMGGYPQAVQHYLIPDGTGNWMRTDPRKDQERITRINRQHGGLFLPVVRLLKHWNVYGAQTKPRLKSYYFETLVGKVFEGGAPISSVQDGVARFLSSAGIYLNLPCPDPKGLGDALDAGVSSDTKQKVSAALLIASTNAVYAQTYERIGNEKDAISWWGRVFGSSFPTYG